MKVSKLLVLGVLVSSLCVAGSAFGQCNVILTSGLNPTGGTYQIGDTIEYTIFVQVPDGLGACTLFNVDVYFFPPPNGAHPGTACDDPTAGTLIASGLTLAPGDAALTWDSGDNGILAYVVQASDAGNELHADAAFVFHPGDEQAEEQCDEKAAHNDVECPEPCVEITKELVPGSPTFSKVGDEVNYRICITNCGTFDLTDVVVSDPLLGGVLAGFPSVLAPQEQVCVDFLYTVQEGDPDPLTNTATVTGIDACDGVTEATDEASFEVDLVQPCIQIVKECEPSEIVAGQDVTYTFTVTNCGNVTLENIVVTDDQLGAVGGAGTLNPAGELIIVVVTPVLASVTNTATVNATVIELGNEVSDTDTCEVTVLIPDTTVDIKANGSDGPITVCEGDEVTLTVCEENTGQADLTAVQVVVNDGTSDIATLTAPPDSGDAVDPGVLNPGETWCWDVVVTVAASTTYSAVGEGTDPAGNVITYPEYANERDEVTVNTEACGGEGCTPGFWKNNAENWSANAWDCYSPSTSFSSVFGVTITIFTGGNPKNSANYITNPTLLQALGANGGGINALARHAVAALLNACSDCVDYPIGSPADVIDQVHDAILAGADAIEALHILLGDYNELGCPINQHGECVGVDEL